LLAVMAFVALHVGQVPFPAILAAAAGLGLVGRRAGGSHAHAARQSPAAESAAAVIDDHTPPPPHAQPTRARALRVLIVCLLLWWLPVLGVALALGASHVLVQEALFFSKAAMVTFGGAYAVLPYVAQQAVEHYGWLGATEMVDGLGLAETTPGPLILVLQFVGFLGAYHAPAPFPPLLAATLGAAITTWTTFVPCFLWILLGAPYIEHMRGQRLFGHVLSAITASVVGVMLSLAVWFGLHVLRHPDGGLHQYNLVIAAIAFVGLRHWGWGMTPVVLGAALLGILKSVLF
jgi:chromate transporter